MSGPEAQPGDSPSPGEYELIGEIAQGGMARVCLARRAGQAGFQRLFALKIMHAHLAQDEEFIEMLLDEARVSAGIHHPNVGSILDLGRSSDGGYFLVMDYVEGAPLSDLLKRGGGTPRRLVPVILDTLSGLSAAHSLLDEAGEPLNIVHRDVSPQNVLVGLDGSARLVDFGIAKARARATTTQPGVIKGKLAYMAPEQVSGELIDARADTYALGVILWRALTGERLFRGDTDVDTLRNVLQQPVPAPSTVGYGPPAVFDPIVLRALARDPQERYESAAEFADALRRAALEHDLLGSRREVGSWVDEAVGERLRARREKIREASDHRTAQVRDGALELSSGSLTLLPTLTPASSSGNRAVDEHTRTAGLEVVYGNRASVRRRLGTSLVACLLGVAATLGALWAFGSGEAPPVADGESESEAAAERGPGLPPERPSVPVAEPPAAAGAPVEPVAQIARSEAVDRSAEIADTDPPGGARSGRRHPRRLAPAQGSRAIAGRRRARGSAARAATRTEQNPYLHP